MALHAPTWLQRHTQLLEWYRTAKRDLPWRQSADPYAITVSEFMLQQTQVITVIPYYHRWLKLFPTWSHLAEAPIEQVLHAWEGLGYYTRARNLHRLAQQVRQLDGVLPSDLEKLLHLPGFGPYTAAAVGSIAFGLAAAVLDGNVIRVLARLESISTPIDRPAVRKQLQELADFWLESGLSTTQSLENIPGTHNQAVMELGATLCVPRKPQCLICPLHSSCTGRFNPESFPVKLRTAAVLKTETIALIADPAKGLLVSQVPPGQAWAGLWRFPEFDLDTMTKTGDLPSMKYGITKYRVTLHAITAELKSPPKPPLEFVSVVELRRRAMAAPHRKLFQKI